MDDNFRNHLNFLSKPENIQEKVNRLYIWQHSSVLSRQNNLCKVDVLPTFYWCIQCKSAYAIFCVNWQINKYTDNFLPVQMTIMAPCISLKTMKTNITIMILEHPVNLGLEIHPVLTRKCLIFVILMSRVLPQRWNLLGQRPGHPMQIPIWGMLLPLWEETLLQWTPL